MTEDGKVQVYLFEELPLEVLVIDRKGKIVRKEVLKWDGERLRFLEIERA